MANSSGRPALHGIRVLDFGHIVAGPFCARILADLGAEVVKVETSRRLGQTGARRGDTGARGRHGRPPLLAHINRNRRSIDLDLKSISGREIGFRLAAAADVVVENFSAGVMERLGLGYRELQTANSRLIYASMSGYGHTGSRSAWTSMNVNLQAHCGLMTATGAEGDPPIGISNSWNDYIAGLHAALAIIGAIAERERTGRGRHLDVSQFEACVATLGSLVFASSVTGIAPQRLGNRSQEAAPQGCYPSAGKDEWCVISIRTDDEWRRLATSFAADIPELGDPRFGRLAGRMAAHAEIDAALSNWTRGHAAAAVEARLKSIAVHAESVRRADSMLETAEWQSLLRPMSDPPGPDAKVVGLPFRFGNSAAVPPVAASRVGEDTVAVLYDWLGMSAEPVEEATH